MNGLIKKIKNFIHKYEILEKLVFYLWSIFCLIRAKFIFRKTNPVRDFKDDEERQGKCIFNGIKHNSAKNNLKVIILGLRTIPTTNLVYFDAIFAQAFKKLGCDVKMLYCDGVLGSCDADTVFRNQKAQCFVCKKFGRPLKKTLNLDCFSFRQYISDLELAEIKEKVKNIDEKELLNYNYLGVKVGEHASSSAIRYFLFGKLNLSDSFQVSLLREKLFYAMVNTKIAKGLIDKEKPDVILMVHGVYSTWGPFAEYFRSKNIDTVIYSNMPPRFGHFIFNRNSKSNEIVSKQAWLDFSNQPLGKEEEEQINNYLKIRGENKTGDQKIYTSNFDNSPKKLILKLLSEKEYKRRYVMYPNLAWDVGIEGKISEIFDDVFDWLDKTIEFFKNKRNYQLIIKPHPAELVWEGTNKGINNYIREKHLSLPKNIILLEPNVSLNAYNLVDKNSIALIYNGTLGLELAFLGVPVLAVAHIHYREAGVVKKIKTLDEYLKLLENPEEIISFAKNNISLAKKYAYFYFLKSMVKIPFYREDRWSVIDWSVLRDTEKLFADESNVIKICKKIINKEDIVAPL